MSDISTAGSRVLSHTVYKKSTIAAFLTCLILWVFFRNICIPLLCYECWLRLKYVPELAEFDIAPKILTGLLTLLCFMHVYWLVLMSSILIKGLKSG